MPLYQLINYGFTRIPSQGNICSSRHPHFTLNKFEGMDGAMSWLAVIVVFIVIALPILFCCSSCACCRTCGMGIIKGTWFGVKGSCTLSWKLISYLYRKKQSRTRGDDGCPNMILQFSVSDQTSANFGFCSNFGAKFSNALKILKNNTQIGLCISGLFMFGIYNSYAKTKNTAER